MGHRVYLHYPSEGFYHGMIVSLECDANAIEVESEDMYEADGEVWRERKYEIVSITDKKLEKAVSEFNSRVRAAMANERSAKKRKGSERNRGSEEEEVVPRKRRAGKEKATTQIKSNKTRASDQA